MSEHVVSMYLQRKSGTRETRALQSVWAAPPCAPRSAPARARRAARARAHRPRRPEPGAAPGAGRGAGGALREPAAGRECFQIFRVRGQHAAVWNSRTVQSVTCE